MCLVHTTFVAMHSLCSYTQASLWASDVIRVRWTDSIQPRCFGKRFFNPRSSPACCPKEEVAEKSSESFLPPLLIVRADKVQTRRASAAEEGSAA